MNRARVRHNPTRAAPAGLLLAIALASASLTTQAVPIAGLFNTGVDGAGNALPSGASDPHYSILAPAQAAIVISPAHPAWIPNAPNYAWVWQNANGQPTNVTRTFRTVFDLTGLDPATAAINGTWATDNTGLDILINDASTGNACGGFSAFCNFSVVSGFVSGINTLDFVVNDFGVISGFLVGSIAGTADSVNGGGVPEPASLALLGLGLAGIGWNWKRKT